MYYLSFFALLFFMVSTAFSDTDIELEAGWNLVSGPIVDTHTVAHLSSSYVFDGSQDSQWEKDLPSISDGQGAWLNLSGESSYSLADSSITAVTDYTVATGWNLLGAAMELERAQVHDLMAAETVWTYDASARVWSRSTEGTIAVGQGFWVLAGSDSSTSDSSSSTTSSSSSSSSSSSATSGDFSITSQALKSKNQLPFSYTCDGLQSDGERGGRAPTLTFNNAPDGTEAYAITMHIIKGEDDNQEREVLWVLYDVPSSTTTLDESDADEAAAGTLGISEQGEYVYFPPCSKGVKLNTYTITAYALSDSLGIAQSDATFDAVTTAAEAKALSTATLEVSNIRYNPDDETQPFVPTKVPVTCEEKSTAFDLYDDTSVSCDEANNQMTVTSQTGVPERSELYVDRLNVGTEAWIGRVPIPSETEWNIPMNPTYLDSPASNINIHHQIGITVDGIPMLHYAKENSPDEIADLSTDYSGRDTVLLGELDQCGGHAGNGEDYHYHYLPICMMDTHEPSEPMAYMLDGMPLYFGTGGGTVTDQGGITSVDYGGGRYDELNYLPSDVKDGTNPLDACNAYDLNGDGATSGYVYYTSKTAPYTIGCFRAEADQEQAVASYSRWDVERDISWTGSDVLLSDYYTSEFDGKSWYFMEVTPDEGNQQIAEGNIAVILWRQLGSDESGYEAGRSCWAFRYRLDKTDTAGTNDTTTTHCRD